MLSGYFVELFDFSLVGARPCGRITVKNSTLSRYLSPAGAGSYGIDV